MPRILDEDQYAERFTVWRSTPYGRQVIGSKNTEELAQRLRPFMSRVKKRDVLKDLPPLMFTEYPLPKTAMTPALKSLAGSLGLLLTTDDTDEFLAELQANTVHLSELRRLTGEAKVAGVAELVEDLLAQDPERKVLVFAHHKKVIQALGFKLKDHGVIIIDGSVPPRTRTKLVEVFQNDVSFRVAVLNIVAAGTAATLHRADEVIFAEASWTPAENNQAASRAHRIGQQKSVTARFVTLPGTIDEAIQRVLTRKSREIAGIIDRGKP